SILGQQGGWSNRGDRRWLGAKNEAWLLLLGGQAEAAEASLRRALSLCDAEEVGLPLQARLRTTVDLETVLLLAGKDASSPAEAGKRPLPANEFIAQDLR